MWLCWDTARAFRASSVLTPLGFRDQFRDDGMCARVVIEVVGALKAL